jgi:hypothetical protein
MNLMVSSDKPDVLPGPRKLSIRFVPSSPLDVPVRQGEKKSPRDETGEMDTPQRQPLDGERDGSCHTLRRAAV